MGDLKITVRGLAELERLYRDLPDRLVRKVYRTAFREGAKVISTGARGLARQRLQRRSGALLRGIKHKPAHGRRSRTRYPVRYIVGIEHARGSKVIRISRRGGKSRITYSGNPFYGRFLEAGTKHIRARRFLRDALERLEGSAVAKITSVARAEFQRIVRL